MMSDDAIAGRAGGNDEDVGDVVESSRAGGAGAVLRALRPVQWVKNLLVAVPLVLAHQISNREKLFDVLLAVAAFCLCASAVYVLNDLIDREADRHHPRKRHRPFASGQLSTGTGVVMIAV